LAASLEHLGHAFKNDKALDLAETVDLALGKFLYENKSHARKVGQIDNRGSPFYLGHYWAQALETQTKDTELQSRFTQVAKDLATNESQINEELLAAQGKPVDMGGYYHADKVKVGRAMRPSATLNAIITNMMMFV
jgi:isocitrate dehydrogenase